MKTRLTGALLLLCGALLMAADQAATIKSALDASAEVTFTYGKGTFTAAKTYSQTHIYGTVKPEKGTTMLQIKNGGDSNKEGRAARISAAFSFTVTGPGTVTFSARVATYMNDDVLVLYEDDIDDPIVELGGDYWYKRDSEYKNDPDLDYGYDLLAADFWNEYSFIVPTDKYTHTYYVALLAPYKDDPDDYWAPEDDEVVVNLAWLDNFIWEPDEDVILCALSGDTAHPNRQFGPEGMYVSVISDYNDGENLLLDYWYTTDGSTPTRNGKKSKKYDGEEGIFLPGTTPVGNVTVRVAAYYKTTQVGTCSATYTRRKNVGTPVVKAAALDDFSPALTLTLACDADAQDITYYYTLDGSRPTEASQKADGATLRLQKPATVSVVAGDGASVSATPLVLQVTQASAPQLEVTADGQKTANTVFSHAASVRASAATGSLRYRLDGGAATPYTAPVAVTQSATLAFVACGEANTATGLYRLNSAAAEITLARESASDGAWATAQVAAFRAGEWNLFAVTRRLSDESAAAIAAWLHPYAYNTRTHAYERAATLQPGTACLVHTSLVEEASRPAAFTDAGAATPLQGGGTWLLGAEKADFTWDGAAWQAVPQDESHPGWRK